MDYSFKSYGASGRESEQSRISPPDGMIQVICCAVLWHILNSLLSIRMLLAIADFGSFNNETNYSSCLKQAQLLLYRLGHYRTIYFLRINPIGHYLKGAFAVSTF